MKTLKKLMKILIACEFSGTVRDAFTKKGHDVTSCDLLPSDTVGKHYQGDVCDIINEGWDLMIAHPPCTHLAVSGSRYFKEKIKDGRQKEGIDFFMKLINAPILRIAVENPICIMSSKYRKPDQIIQPWMFGHMETKATCLWLKGLPLLKEENNVKEEMKLLPKKEQQKIHYMSPSKDRSKLRSITYQGIAEAMANQWG